MKKYIASSLKEAIEKMKNELGEEAVVLSAKVIDSIPGTRTKMFEVVAGLDTGEAQPKKQGYQSQQPTRKPAPEMQRSRKPESAASEVRTPQPEKPNESADFERALEDLKQKIYQAKKAQQPQGAAKPAPEKQRKGGPLAFALENMKNGLLERDIQPSIVNTIMAQAEKAAEFLKPADLESTVISAMASMIPTAGFELKKRRSGKVVALVGPTGVGKTTCIAKIAVISKLLHKLDIGLISLDTYRLGAIDQLKTFSEISSIDFLVAYDEKDLPKMIKKFKNKDIIFLDTAGRSQNNTKLIEETQKVLASVKVDDIILVLSSTASTANLNDYAKKFAVFNYGGLIFTKLDESVVYGNLLNVVVKTKVPVKYITNGQVIPDDIIAAEPEHLANLIYSGKYATS